MPPGFFTSSLTNTPILDAIIVTRQYEATVTWGEPVKHLERLFGLDEHRTRHIIKLIIHYIKLRNSEGVKDLAAIERELLTGEASRFQPDEE
jgi:hypothetical protein